MHVFLGKGETGYIYYCCTTALNAFKLHQDDACVSRHSLRSYGGIFNSYFFLMNGILMALAEMTAISGTHRSAIGYCFNCSNVNIITIAEGSL